MSTPGPSHPLLDRFFRLHLLNEGILMTPFHNMAPMCPATTAEQAHGEESAPTMRGSIRERENPA